MTLQELLAIVLALVAYRGVGLLLSRGLGPGHCLFGAIALLNWPAGGWAQVEGGHALLTFTALLAFILSWRCTTEDLDLGGADDWDGRRACWCLMMGVLLHPLVLLPFLALLKSPLPDSPDHRSLPIRTLQMVATVELLGPFTAGGNTLRVVLLLILAVISSHYFRSAVGKMRLGKYPWSWAMENRLDLLVMTAYGWGWRFFPKTFMLELSRVIRFLRVPLQLGCLVVESGALWLLLDPLVCHGLLLGLCLLHLAVFVMSGILFWEWLVTLAAVSSMLADPSVKILLSGLYHWHCQIVLIAIVVTLPWTRVWVPQRFAWWDGPLTARLHWRVVGASGQVYGLYNNFMCPHERLYGGAYGFFMVEEPVLSSHGLPAHLGHLQELRLRDALIISMGESQRIRELKLRFGRKFSSRSETEAHLDYLKRMFARLNSGCRKTVVPRALKAPGELYFYWGDLPAYRRQEPVVEIIISYEEQFYDGRRLLPVCRRDLQRICLDLELERTPEAGPGKEAAPRKGRFSDTH